MTQPDDLTKEPPLSSTQTQKHLNTPPDHEEQPFRRFHQYRLSDAATASTESSPTTTISTVDDSSATEPSPGSSPESPPPTTFAAGMLRPRTADDSRPFFELQKQQLPRKGRNLKGLAVDTSRLSGRTTASTTSLPLPVDDQIPVASPSFVKPPTPQKRKPSSLGLTLLTPGLSKAPLQEIKLAIPPTPGLNRLPTLRHFQSSPTLPFLPQRISIPQNPGVKPALETILSPTSPIQQTVDAEEQNFDIPLSREEKPEAYPEGPICVYEPYVDLYLEPTAEQCRQYDVVVNVASEVRNPLDDQAAVTAEEPEIRIDGGGGIQYAPRRDQLPIPQAEESRRADASPTTPKASVMADSEASLEDAAPSRKEPEYIHMMWEHNSDIVPDLLKLVKLIEEKVSEGKRILIHCQCGVSRSASLVVAYGLYKDPTLSVQEAYDTVKKRSKWIGPNMNLIMQLQEFRTSLQRDGLLSADRGMSPLTPSSALSEWGGPFSARTPAGDVPMSAGVAPLLPSHTAESLPMITPGPSSAPSGFAWPLTQLPSPPLGQRARAISAAKPSSAYVSPSGRVVPVVPVLKLVDPEGYDFKGTAPVDSVHESDREQDSATPTGPVSAAPTEEFAMTPLQPSPDVDSADSFGLMSPISTEFASSPFDRSALLAQLGMGSMTTDDHPRRSISLKSQKKPASKDNDMLSAQKPRLRGKISSPSLREQQQLQSLQAKIEASLPHRTAKPSTTYDGMDDALMSPRATEFTKNPFALSLTIPPPVFEEEAVKTADSDPRSPAQKGISPFVRSIDDVL